MRITETARVFISLPFRTDGLEAEHPGCLKSFDARHINRFLSALEREIQSTAEECDDLQVREIVLGNGSAAHFTADDLTGMIRSVRNHFRVSQEVAIRLTMTPSGFDFYKLSAVKQMGNVSICFEIPALTEDSLREGGYHCSAEKASDALNCCFQNGFRAFAVSLSARSLKTEEAESTLKTLLAVHPEEISLQESASSELRQTAESMFSGAGWLRAENNRWYRERIPKQVRCAAQIGCGPNAVSVFDGLAVRTTSDFDFYCDHADDFEALAEHAQTENLA